jgi:hypothetical protein
VGVRAAFAIAVCALGATAPAFAQGSIDEGLRDCEKLAAVKFKRDNPAFKRFAIEREGVEQDKFTDKVGSQFVSSVYLGRATYQAAGAPESVRFICLHAGYGKGAVFVYTLPLN